MRDVYTRLEVEQALNNTKLCGDDVTNVLHNLPSGKRELTMDEKDCRESFNQAYEKLEQSIKYLNFWKDYAHLIQNKNMEERIEEHIFELECGGV